MKTISFLTIIFAYGIAYGGGSTNPFQETKRLACEGSAMTAFANISLSVVDTSLTEVFKHGVSPVLKITDSNLIANLIGDSIVVPNGLFDWSTNANATTLSLILDSNNIAKQANYLSLNGHVGYKSNDPMIHFDSKPVDFLLDSQTPKSYTEFRIELVGASEIQLRISAITPEIRHCTEFKTVPNPWIIGKTFEVCTKSDLVEEKQTIVKFEESYSIDSCEFQL